MNQTVTVATLQDFSAAWNRHDLAALMSFMHDECVFETAAGPDACGSRHVGASAVAVAFASAWATCADARWTDAEHWVFGEHGVSRWTFCGTLADGSRIEADGIDLFAFKDGKIVLKNVFRKDRPRLPALPVVGLAVTGAAL